METALTDQLFSIREFGIFLRVFGYLFDYAYIWAPFVFGYLALKMWIIYAKTDFILKQGSVLLEIKLPKEAPRSPKAMEIFITALCGAATEIDTYWWGKIRPWWSFEMVSLGGQVHFYIWAHRKWKNLVEAQLYASYPGIEVYEAEDYLKTLYHDPMEKPFWALNFKMDKPDPYPIMTYVDYGLDRDQKEEYKVDPLVAVLEYLASMKSDDIGIIQILFQAHKKERFADGRLIFRKDWKDAIKKEVEKIRKEAAKAYGEVVKSISPEGKTPFPMVSLTKGQEEQITAMERSMAKFPFECIVRGIYYTTKESFNPVYINGLIGSMRQFSSNTMNGFKTGWYTDFDYPWQDFHRLRRNLAERGMLRSLKMRSFFHAPYRNFHSKPYILTTEELATIFHFPSAIAAPTPTIARVSAKKVEAPANLPT
ncbi:MAG: hypothetical protein UY17_C0038G0003 [Candidatus Beckwithbacteria bacterium GW2011_GWC2_47_9]|uniref:DUF8128 domain-containing protein n=1 Tax=Candidatus Beckwithbacteria bacterium GW2011_GWC2_47_9 TaxID=1618373 RepID=A0A0G1TYI4_9BACT|nr:MAG: hypothetical protein UY17_C0038G0003 [Candidatus Beckwithbacteria bacterium GW2011_GWC2_47_9]